ncbi:BMP family ABC transporter substrate-binding protein [Amycolatopsis sp. NPDC051758]|uniref:BMP family ABC transporter substrate-binding protein n=1 Tax=Amycolatopsis sp. NPDC051758 TaxID=3363935 RepID=UPI003787A493
MRSKLVAAMTVAVLAGAATASCTSATDPATGPGIIRVAIILGGIQNDGGFNQAGASAVRALQDEGQISGQIRESVATARDAEPIVRQFAADGYDLVIGWSATFADSLYQVAGEFPKTKFMVTGDATDKQKTTPNVETWNYSAEEFGYLLGWIAGQTRLTPIGVVDGQALPSQKRKWHGFELGVHAVNPGAEVRAPVYTGSWEDAQAANQATVAQLGAGAHLIATNSEGYSPGVAAAAAARNVATVGMSSATSDAAKKVNVGRARLDMLPILRAVLDRLKTGKFGGQTSVSTIANHSLVLDTITKVEATPALPDDLQARAADLAQQLADGKIKIGS